MDVSDDFELLLIDLKLSVNNLIDDTNNLQLIAIDIFQLLLILIRGIYRLSELTCLVTLHEPLIEEVIARGPAHSSLRQAVCDEEL